MPGDSTTYLRGLTARKFTAYQEHARVRPMGSGPGGWRHGRLFNSCARRRGFHYAPHSHASLTTHLIVAGELTLWYPNETSQQRVTYGPGSRVDVEAGRVHEVWVGDEGCTYVIGEC